MPKKPLKRATRASKALPGTTLAKPKKTQQKALEGHLFTSSDVAKYRDTLIKEQEGIDPILQEPFKEQVVLDHSHSSQKVRAALNRNTNAFEGLVANAYLRCLSWLTEKDLPTILRNLADYLEQDYSRHPYHPGWLKACKVLFNKLNATQQSNVLQFMQEKCSTAVQCRNAKERKALFSKLLLTREFSYDIMLALLNSQIKENE